MMQSICTAVITAFLLAISLSRVESHKVDNHVEAAVETVGQSDQPLSGFVNRKRRRLQVTKGPSLCAPNAYLCITIFFLLV